MLAGSSSSSGPAASESPSPSPKKDRIMLNKVKSLTLRAGRMTASRRVTAIPQVDIPMSYGKKKWKKAFCKYSNDYTVKK